MYVDRPAEGIPADGAATPLSPPPTPRARLSYVLQRIEREKE